PEVERGHAIGRVQLAGARKDALLDEVARSQSGAVDSATAVRSGRLARAGRMVRGSITQLEGRSLRADAAVVNVSTAQVGTPINTDFGLDAVFDAEKRIVLGVFADMGITLTPAERAAIEQRPTKSLAAFLAYSRGLAAEDAGRYGEAARLFEEAKRIDPGFGAAQSAASRAQASTTGASITPAIVESSLAGTTEGAIVTAATAGADDAGRLAFTAAAARDAINPSPAAIAAGATVTLVPTKEGAAIATGGDVVTLNAGRIIIQVPLPLPK
ncbi:MAG TPA: tetratricopeptide repeat protein, partial [Gemmatimonadaceae bacterium]|nr:tetratricopeptide repeat protein [Gemmatimonadaceae bacterium]